MADIATSVRIPSDAIHVLARLSERLKQSKAQVIERALRDLEERLFWAETAEAFSRISNDPEEFGRLTSEFDVWDGGTSRDYSREEKW